MQLFVRVLIALFGICFLWISHAHAVEGYSIENDLRTDQPIDAGHADISMLEQFASGFKDIFFMPPERGGSEGVMAIFINIAFAIKNFFIIVAVIFLIIGVLKFLFSEASEEEFIKWRTHIIWVSVGIFLMQISFSAWSTLMAVDSTGGGTGINAVLSWKFWGNIFEPIVNLLQFLASFAFLFIMIRAFYRMVLTSSDEESRAEGVRTLIYACIGFLLIKLPYTIVSLIYSNVPKCDQASFFLSVANPCSDNTEANLSKAVELLGNILKWVNTFLTIACVILIIYTGFLVLTSRGDEEALSKAKRNILYVAIGLLLLFASHALFRFFVLDIS